VDAGELSLLPILFFLVVYSKINTNIKAFLYISSAGWVCMHVTEYVHRS